MLMQNSELYRRGIVLPVDATAEASLRCDGVDLDTNAKHLRIDGDDLFVRLWRLGLFQEINDACGTMLDDYEVDYVEPRGMEAFINAVGRLLDQEGPKEPGVLRFLQELQAIGHEAKRLCRPLLFVL